MEAKDIVSYWGALVATILGAIKIFEFYRDRGRLGVSYSFVGLPEIGNTITIHNLGAKAVTITYYELFWSTAKSGWEKDTMNHLSPDYDFESLVIAPGDHQSLNFANENDFPIQSRTIQDAHLYISLHIVGKNRPKILKVV